MFLFVDIVPYYYLGKFMDIQNVQIDPALFQQVDKQESIAPQVYSQDDLDYLRKKETEVSIKGDIFTYSGVNFKPLTQEELLNEKIDIKSLDLKSMTTSKETVDYRTIIAFRDPSDPEKIIAYKLDKEIVDELKESFSADNFFQREDGILRLNTEAEAYIAGWVQDIKINRGYENADANGNGYIEDDEKGELNVGFDHNTDYDYLGEKIVSAHTAVGARKYQKYSDTQDYLNPTNILHNQSLKFKDTIEKELSHTLKLDKDKDGTITLKEGLEDFTHSNNNVENYLVEKVKSNHNTWVRDFDIVLDPNAIATRDISTLEIRTQEEWEQATKELNEHMIKIQTDEKTLKMMEDQWKIYKANLLKEDAKGSPFLEKKTLDFEV